MLPDTPEIMYSYLSARTCTDSDIIAVSIQGASTCYYLITVHTYSHSKHELRDKVNQEL